MDKPKITLAMAFSRDTWISHMRNRLIGPLREYAKDQMAPLAGITYSWHDEIETLMVKVKDLFDPKKTKTKTKFDMNKAFSESFLEAAGEQYKVREAISIFVREYLSDKSVEDKLKFQAAVKHFDSEELLINMLQEYAPELIDRLQIGME